MPTRVHSTSASAMACDVSTMVCPALRANCSASHSPRRALGSIPVVGSSISSTCKHAWLPLLP